MCFVFSTGSPVSKIDTLIHLLTRDMDIVPRLKIAEHVAALHFLFSIRALPLAANCEKLHQAQALPIHMEIWEYK